MGPFRKCVEDSVGFFPVDVFTNVATGKSCGEGVRAKPSTDAFGAAGVCVYEIGWLAWFDYSNSILFLE